MKMRNLGNIVWGLMLSVSLNYAASVRAMVDTTEVVKGNAVTLRIEAKGSAVVFPKIVMVADARVQGTSTSSSQNWSLINGAMSNESSTTKSIQFVPNQTMTIPAYTVTIDGKEYKTDPIEIKIVKSTAPSSKANAAFGLTLKSSKDTVYVGESFMLTAYFSLRSDIGASPQVKYTPPVLSDFLVTDAGEKPAYIKGNYQIQEIDYIVTAQKEGNFTVNPASAKVGIADRNDPFARMMFARLKWYQTVSNALSIEVLPQAIDSDLIGDFRIESHIDAQEVNANKPVNLTVKIEGNGNLEGVEFPKYEIDGVTIYSDEAKIDTKVVNGKLYSIYSKSFAFISEEDFTIPERTFSLYDLKTKSLKSLKIDSYTIKIKALKKSNAHTVAPVAKGVVQTNETVNEVIKEVIVEKNIEVKSVAWWILVLAFILGMFVMYLLRFIPQRKTKPYKESQALKILYGHISESTEIEEMVRKLYAKKNGDTSIKIDKKALKAMVERF